MSSRFHREIGRPTKDTPEAIAERIRHRAAADQVRREIAERWPVITAENFQAVDDYRVARLRELNR